MTRILPAWKLSLAAVCALLCLLLASGDALAQANLPTAPAIDSVTAGDGSLTVAWTAPTSNGGRDITAYDLRYTKTSADETVDGNWTLVDDVWTGGAGGLEYTITRLENGVGYDVQARAVNANGDGQWSATFAGTPADHGDTRSAATDLELNTSIVGTVDSASDEDYFRITLAEASGIFIFTTSYITGFLPTTGELQGSGGAPIKTDDQDSTFRQYGPQLFLWSSLDAGTYYVKVGAAETGTYTLHTQTIKDTTSTVDAADLALGSSAFGILETVSADEDYFRIELSQAGDLMVRLARANANVDAEGTLLDSNGTEIAVRDDSFFTGALNERFIIRKELDAGVYYLKVRGAPAGSYNVCRGYTPEFYRGNWRDCNVTRSKISASEAGPYTVSAATVTPPGGSRGAALPLPLGEGNVAGGRIDRVGDADYFKITVDETTHVRVQVRSASVDTDGELFSGRGNSVDTRLDEKDYDPGGLGFTLYASLGAGTSYIRVTASDNTESGPYAIMATEDTAYASFIDGCSAMNTDYDDPLYGCQWHLNNTGQNTRQAAGTPGEDINVEDVWAAGNLGAGINVAIVDDGLYYDHEDLRDNVNKSRNQDYTPRGDVFERYFDHGTKVAGVIAARDNSLGTRGVAPRATIYGYNWIRNTTFGNLTDAMTRNLADTWVSNNSWSHLHGPGVNAAPRLWELAIDAGVANGLDGKGIFYVFGAGNGGLRGDNSNLSGFSNYYGVTAACAVNDLGQRSAVSEQGANLWVCGPSADRSQGRQSIPTTTNYDRYEQDFGGTSAAAAVVSGVAALVRNANRELTWRDVKLILAASARKNDSGNTGWETGALKYGSDTERYQFNHEYGFGVVDAKAAVELAGGWTTLPPLRKQSAATATDIDLSIPDAGASVSSAVTVRSDVAFIEFVEVNAVFDHPSFRDLTVELVSPSAAVSKLSVPYQSTEKFPLSYGFRFGTSRHLGESAAGTWTLRLTDSVTGSEGTLESWSITVYGHSPALALGAPVITSMAPSSGALAVAWSAPEDTGDSAITAYDLRHIRSDATDKADANWTEVDNAWTSGDLQYTLGGLSNGTGYDVQVRAVNDEGDGPWSDTATGTPAASQVTAPTIDSVRADDGALAVVWNAPTGATNIITAYDVRHIRSDATDKADANWTVKDDAWTADSGGLKYAVAGLTNGVRYDVQVRAVDSTTDGPWSATASETPADYGDTQSSATTLAPDTEVWGTIDPGGEEDYFKLQLSRTVGLWIFTTGDLDTVGALLDSSGLPIAGNDDGNLAGGPLNFFIWRTLDAGTYYVRVNGFRSSRGAYVLRTRTFTDTPSRANAAKLELGGSASGMLDPGGDVDYFRLELSENAEVNIRSAGFPRDTVGLLLDSRGRPVATNDDGFLQTGIYQFLIRQALSAGVYYLEVSGYGEDDIGPFSVYATAVTEPGSTIADAQPLTLGDPAGGNIDPAGDVDYFSITVDSPAYVSVRAVSAEISTAGLLVDSDDDSVEPDLLQGGGGPIGFTIQDRLDSGTHYIKVSGRESTETGRYTILAIEDREYPRVLDQCSNIDTSASIDDALYGCQWHLSNAGQFVGSASQDINVEDVWTSGTLGEGITVAVVDDGMHHGHEDLSANVTASFNHDYTGGDDIYDPAETHGTAVAGLVAARDNNLGMRGVAPRATIYGYNLLLDKTELNEAHAMAQNATTTAIFNNSWGPADLGAPEFTNSFWEAAVEDGVTTGYGGKGTLYVWAAGNGGLRGDYSNLDEYGNFYGVTAVCAVNHADFRSSYSEPGSNLWVCAPSDDPSRGTPGIATTDNGNRYTAGFGGTSAATPIVSGVAALIRDADEDLTWRDLKLILAASARKNDADNTGWETGALKYDSTTERYEFNHEYGFGVVDAEAAVDLAKSWTNAPTLREISAGTEMIDLEIPDALSGGPGATVTSSVTVEPYVGFIEFVEVNAHFDHPSFRDLDVELVSPAGVISKLVPPSSRTLAPLTSEFRFGSARHLGENSAGVWTLRATDYYPADRGTLVAWSLTIYGHGSLPGRPDIDELDPGDAALTVTWKAPTDIGGSNVTTYDLRHIRSDTPDKSDAQWRVEPGVWNSGSLEYTITGLKGGVEYQVEVRAVNDTGAGPWSETNVATPTAAAPSAPTIQSVSPGDGVLGVLWTAPGSTGGDDIAAYDIRHIESTAPDKADANWMVLDSVWTTGDLRYVASSLANGTEYDVQVRAVNSAGDGDWSVTLTGTPKQGDVPVTMGWEQTAVTVVEGAGTTTLRAVATTTQNTAPATDFSFDFTVTTNDSSATQPTDYAPLSVPDAFIAGDFSQADVNGQPRYRAEKEFVVTINDDAIDEPDEDFKATLAYSHPGLAHLQGRDSVATINIIDNDQVPVTLGWERTAVPADEGAGAVVLSAIAVTTKDKFPDEDFSFNASVSTSEGDATQPVDYTGLFEMVTFNRNDFRRVTVDGRRRYRAVKQIEVAIADDEIDEPEEDFKVTVAYSNPSLPHLQGGPATTTVTIADDDHVPVTIGWEEPAVTVSEEEGSVTLDAVATTVADKMPEEGFSFNVTVTTADGAAIQPADYGRLSRTQSFRRSDFSRAEVGGQQLYRAVKQFAIRIVDDSADEPDEDFIAMLAYSDPSLPHLQGPGDEATVTITDDDVPKVTIAADAVTVTEAQSTTFTLTRGGVLDTSLFVDVRVTETGDMLAPSNAMPVFFSLNSATANFRVDFDNDTKDEDDSVVTVGVVAGDGYEPTSPNSARTTVTDDDHVPVTLGWQQADVTVNEGGGSVTLRAVATTETDKAPEDGFTFDVSVDTSNGSASQPADYTRLSTTATFDRADFRRGTVNGQRRYRAVKQFEVSIAEDEIDESEEDFNATVAYLNPGLPHLTGMSADTTVTIIDNDYVPVTIEWEQRQVGAGEDAGSITLNAIATTTKDRMPEEGFSFGVTVTTADGTATEPTDYVSLSRTQSFRRDDFRPKNVSGQQRYQAKKQFAIRIVGDSADEDNEDFTATLAYSNPDLPFLMGVSDTVTVTIDDDYENTVDLRLAAVSSPARIVRGRRLTYRYTITNRGPETATGVALDVTLDDEVSFVSVDPTAGCSPSGATAGGTVTCQLADLDADATATVNVAVTVNDIPTLGIANDATVRGSNFDRTRSNDAATVITRRATAPGRVTNLTATAQGTSQINLAWSRPADNGSRITGYRLERQTGSGSYSPVTPVPAAGATTYGDTELSAGTANTYRLRAVNSAGAGSWSNEVSATTDKPAPPPPPPQRRSGGGSGSVGGGFVSGGGGGAPSLPVSTAPIIVLSPRTLSFAHVEGGNNPAQQTLQVWNLRTGGINFSVTGDASWLFVNPASSTSDGPRSRARITVSVDASGLEEGTYTGTIHVAGNGISNSPRQIPVTLTVTTAAFTGSLAREYDADNNAVIDRDEVLAAIGDYFKDRISLEDVFDIIRLYFAG